MRELINKLEFVRKRGTSKGGVVGGGGYTGDGSSVGIMYTGNSY